jgi:hypothetical protein
MSTLNSATLQSDDESDQDFVPSPQRTKKRRLNKPKAKVEDDGSGSSGSSSDSDDNPEERVDLEEIKRLDAERKEAEDQRRKEAAARQFASMKEDAGPGASNPGVETRADLKRLVEIKRPRQFAGKTI